MILFLLFGKFFDGCVDKKERCKAAQDIKVPCLQEEICIFISKVVRAYPGE